MERLKQARDAETQYLKERDELEVAKTKEMADIETEKFKSMVNAIGPQTLLAMANAGPDMQVFMFDDPHLCVYLPAQNIFRICVQLYIAYPDYVLSLTVRIYRECVTNS